MYIEISFKNRDGGDGKESYPVEQIKKIRPWYQPGQNPLTFIVVADLERGKSVNYILDIPYSVFIDMLKEEEKVWEIATANLSASSNL